MLRQVSTSTAASRQIVHRQMVRRRERGAWYRGVWAHHTLTNDCAASSSFAARRRGDNPQADGWEHFLRGGLDGISQAAVQQHGQGGDRVQLFWKDGHESEFSSKWLSDHATNAFNPHTKQRQVRHRSSDSSCLKCCLLSNILVFRRLAVILSGSTLADYLQSQ